MTEKKGIEYHSQDQRKHYRISTPLLVNVDGKTYKTKDWSIGGLSLTNFQREVNQGDILGLKVLIKFQDFNISFDAKSKVIGSKDNKLHLKFEDLSDRSKNILQFFSQSIISGQMVDIEDTIKRIDIPINFQEENIEEQKNKRPPFLRLPLKTMFFTTFYLTIGLLLFIYIALVVYSNFVHMKIESAVVSAPIENIVSPFDGVLSQVYVGKDAILKPQEPLVSIKDHELEKLFELEKSNQEQFKAELDLQNKNLAAEKGELKIYADVGTEKIKELKANLNDWLVRNKNADLQYQRMLALYAKHYISKAELDKSETEHTTIMNQVKEATHQLEAQEGAMAAIKSGHYYSFDKVQSDVPQIEAMVEQAERNLSASQDRIEALEKQIAERTLKSPFDGQVIDVFKSQGNTISRGDFLMLIERNEPRVIKAYLTQDEVVEVKMGSDVTVYIPSLRKRFAGTVTQIDRTDGFIDEVNSIYKPRTVNDRSALVTIALKNFDMYESRKILNPGTPSIVYFDRSLSEGVMHRLQMFFTPMNHTSNQKSNAADKILNNQQKSSSNDKTPKGNIDIYNAYRGSSPIKNHAHSTRTSHNDSSGSSIAPPTSLSPNGVQKSQEPPGYGSLRNTKTTNIQHIPQ